MDIMDLFGASCFIIYFRLNGSSPATERYYRSQLSLRLRIDFGPGQCFEESQGSSTPFVFEPRKHEDVRTSATILYQVKRSDSRW